MDKKHPNEPKPVTPSEPPPVQAKHGDILIDGVKIEYDRQAPPPATEEDPAPKAENDSMKSELVAVGAAVELK